MSEDENDYKNILKEIFHCSPDNSSDIYPIIKNSDNIKLFKEFMKNKDIINANKILLLKELKTLFEQNDILILQIVNNGYKKPYYFFYQIINLYLSEDVIEENLKFLEEFLILVNSYITLHKQIFDFVYQKLSIYFSNRSKKKLNETQFIRCLSLLRIFYKDTNICESNEIIENDENNEENKKNKEIENNEDNENNEEDENNENNKSNEDKKLKIIKNYIYFSGQNSGLTFLENKNPTNGHITFPTFKEGISFIFWYQINKKLLEYYSKIYPDYEINLFIITIGDYKIKIILKDGENFILRINENESCEIKLVPKENEWNFLSCVIYNKSEKNVCILYIKDGYREFNNLPISNSFPSNQKIDSIKCFENFVGKITSLFFFPYALKKEFIDQLTDNMDYLSSGFYKNEVLFRFLRHHHEHYFKKDIVCKYKNKYKDKKLPTIFLNFERDKKKYTPLNLFSPFAYEKDENQLDDIFGNYIGKLSKNDGVNFFKNYTKDITHFGNIDNLLPIAELMFSSINGTPNKSYTLVEKDILSEQSLFEFLSIIKEIINKHKKNINYINANNFFGSLSLFFEKFPHEIFTEKILDILIDIGLEICGNDFRNIKQFNEHFINCFLLNEKIFSKFSWENQNRFWQKMGQLFSSFSTRIGYYINATKICQLIGFYDQKRYEQFCCSHHASLLNKIIEDNKKELKSDVEIMEPNMDKKVEELFNFFQLYVDKLIKLNKKENDNNSINTETKIIKETKIINLYQLLCLDFSPCIQKKIIQVYINHFNSPEEKVSKEDKLITLINLFENDFIEVTEYVLSISLIDVRHLILKLLIILFNNYLDKFTSFYLDNSNNFRLKNFLYFIGNNSLTSDIKYHLDNNKDNKDDNFINKSSIYIDDNIIENNFINKRSRSSKKNNKNLKTKSKYLFDTDLLANNSIKNINEEIYDKEIKSLNKFLTNWVKELKEINPFTIFLLLNLSKKLSFNFIEKLVYYILCNFKDSELKSIESVQNAKQGRIKRIFSKKLNRNNININNPLQNMKEIIFQWIVDTILFFKNTQNVNIFSKKYKEKIASIQTQAIEVFKLYFNDKKEWKELNIWIKYLFDYLTYLKNIYKNQKEKLEELVNIARELLGIIFKFSEENINMKTIVCFRFIIFFKNCEKLFNINVTRNFPVYESIEKIGKNTFNQNMIINEYISINNPKQIIEIKDSIEEVKTKDNSSNQKSIININSLIPDYILEGLYLHDDILSQDGKKDLKLSEIWKDFTLSKEILNDFQNHYWGKEYLCNKIKLDSKGDLNNTAKLLLEKYGNKNDKKIDNILITEIMNLFSWNSEIINDNTSELNIENKKAKDNKQVNSQNDNKKDLSKSNPYPNSVNILYLNIILLSILVHLSKNEEKKIFIVQYQQFLIFCILASINISSSVKNYDYIQNILSNVLGYGFSFLKVYSEDKYNDLIQIMIMPIIAQINDFIKKTKFKGIFGFQYKLLYKNTAIVKLFVSIPSDNNEKIKDKDIKQNKEENPTNIDNQKNNNKNKVYFEFKNDVNKFIKEIFDKTLEGYKNLIVKKPVKIIVNYFEKYDDKNHEDQNLLEEKNLITNKIKELIKLINSQTEEILLNKKHKYKKRKKNYKNIKTELFSWKGFWSDRFLFFKHPEFLKNKIKNHYTEGMYKFLLSPILDLKYYLPDFSEFDKKKLFQNDDYKYNINLNIDDILGENGSNLIKNIDKEENDNLSNDIKEFNYLELIYKTNYDGIWELYNQNKEKISSILEQKALDIVPKHENEKTKIGQTPNKNNNNIKEKNQNLITIEHKPTFKESKCIKCCLVKSSHHIRGKVEIHQKYLIFYPEHNEHKTDEMLQKEYENDPKFDKLTGCCYGSYFKYFLKDKDKTEISIKYSRIKYIFIRVYFYYESALEIFTFTNKSYYFNFQTNEDMNKFLNKIISSQDSAFIPIKTDNKRLLGYTQKNKDKEKKKCYYISKKQEDWQNYRISTFDYLMWLNIYGGRSFNDINQYPIIPWVLINYDQNCLNKKKRDFSLPMGMIEVDTFPQSSKRKNGFLEVYQNSKNEFEYCNPDFNLQTYLQKGEEYYHNYNARMVKMKSKEEKNNNKGNKTNKNKKTSKGDDDEDDSENELTYEEIQINQIPYIYGSHYSNPLYTSHYLVRIFPFSFISLQIHGDKFDDAERMFYSMKKTFECVCTLKEDIRELIPEFYTFPEMYLNRNNLDLSQGKEDKNGNKIILGDVNLPSWSQNNIGIFTSGMRNFLENNSENINKWIDLIFGINQRGENAELNNNLFMAHSYERMVKIDEVTNPDLRETLMRFIEIGVTPFKIFFNETKDRIDIKEFVKKNSLYNYNKGNFLYDYKELEVHNFQSDIYRSINAKHNYSKDKSENNSAIKIMFIKQITNNNKNYLRIITSSNYWYEMKYNILKGEVSEEEKQKFRIYNFSTKYLASYNIFNLKKIPFVAYQDSKSVIKGGFWDGRLELNDLSQSSTYVSNCIISEYKQPIIIMKMSSDEKYLFCGTYSGLIIVYKINNLNLISSKNIFIHSDEITDISTNTFLNMFATVSKDGYLCLFISYYPKLVRAIKISDALKRIKSMKKNIKNQNDNNNKENIKEKSENTGENQNEKNEIIEEKSKEELKEKDDMENTDSKPLIQEEISDQDDENEDEDEDEEEDDIYADNVFLSSSPLPCVTIYISKLKLFITFTLNGEFISEVKEENNSTYITCSKIITSLTSQEYLIYGTDNGYIKIRRFPDMKFIGENIKVTNGEPIETLEISEDNKLCFSWSKGKEIFMIKDRIGE